MARPFSQYWYRTHPEVAVAYLYHCRDRDLTLGGMIPVGSVVQGEVGFAVAEKDVPGLSGRIIVEFKPNRRCRWQDWELECLADYRVPQPAPAPSSAEMRKHHYVVAVLAEGEEGRAVAARAQELGIPVLAHPCGRNLMTLECARFQKQAKHRRAVLL